MSESKRISRRDFIKVTTGVVGGIITIGVGIPAIAYLLDPAFRSTTKDTWATIGSLDKIPVGKPTPFSFALTQVNGWERTSTTFGGYVLRKSEDPKDLLILSSRCTHLGCTVNWDNQAKIYHCPCHDGQFDIQGKVLAGPPPRPLNQYTDFKVDENGNLLIHVTGG